LNNRSDQFSSIHPESKFQFYEISGIWNLVEKCTENKISLLNVATEPISAQEIASIFDVELRSTQKKIEYRMKSKYSGLFNAKNGFLQDRKEILEGISKLRFLS
jgi:hypothetical protein